MKQVPPRPAQVREDSSDIFHSRCPRPYLKALVLIIIAGLVAALIGEEKSR
jgi:hypothetical protein